MLVSAVSRVNNYCVYIFAFCSVILVMCPRAHTERVPSCCFVCDRVIFPLCATAVVFLNDGARAYQINVVPKLCRVQATSQATNSSCVTSVLPKSLAPFCCLCKNCLVCLLKLPEIYNMVFDFFLHLFDEPCPFYILSNIRWPSGEPA